MNSLLIQFSYLQILDFMTTVAFMVHGVQEGNPVVRVALHYAPHPLGGLLAIKAFAIGMGIYCWRFGRDKVLIRMNILFAVVVAWNLVALIMGAVQTAG